MWSVWELRASWVAKGIPDGQPDRSAGYLLLQEAVSDHS